MASLSRSAASVYLIAIRDPVQPSAALSSGTVPPAWASCVDRIVAGESYYVCGSAWLAPRYGNNGVYYVVVNPLM